MNQKERSNSPSNNVVNINQPYTENTQNQHNVNMNQQHIQAQQPNNPIVQTLSYAYNIFTEGNILLKDFSFYEALMKFEESLKIVTSVYDKIDDNYIKTKTDAFLKNISNQIDFTNYQIQNRFEFKKQAGFANVNKEKFDFTDSIRKAQSEITPVEAKIIVEQEKKAETVNKEPEKKANIVGQDLRDKILTEIVDQKPDIKFTDIIGLDSAKQILKEIIVLPSIRPDLFEGLRSPPRGLLLFGPPGVGKTMIAKAVATECSCTFFNISASSLTSKYLGESEKLVRALFDLAAEKSPSVVFVDEIESILSKRSDGENDATKRLKTEFLIQFDGVNSNQNAKILIIGATNRPFELDSAVIRRLPKRIYIGPFDKEERRKFIKELMKKNENTITDDEYEQIANLTNNYSNSDLKELCREAAYEPIREISNSEFNTVDKLRPLTYGDFLKAVKKVRGTLSDELLKELNIWNESYGALN